MTALAFPAWLYGPTQEVRASVRRHATVILREDSLAAVLSAPLVDVASNVGRVVLARRWIAPGASEPSFHADLLWKELSQRVFKKSGPEQAFSRLASLARAGAAHAWWFAGLLLSESYYLVRRAEEQLQFLGQAQAHWSTLTAIGSRYSPMVTLETTPTLVGFCLARQGAPSSKPPLLPLSAPRLNELLATLPGYKVRKLVADGKLEEAARLLEGREAIPLLSLAEHLVTAGHDAQACDIVRQQNLADPHGIVGRWLDAAGDRERTVS